MRESRFGENGARKLDPEEWSGGEVPIRAIIVLGTCALASSVLLKWWWQVGDTKNSRGGLHLPNPSSSGDRRQTPLC
jgi:hypothetical protein